MTISDSALHDADILRIGDCIVTLSSREVQAPGARRVRRLTPKATGVLRALVRREGRVATREELFAEVWPDTLPSNDVLTQAVTQLRKAFAGSEAGAASYIETIAKSGYRLRAPVSVAAATATVASERVAAGPSGPQAAHAPRAGAIDAPRWRRLRRGVLAAVGVTLLVALALMTWRLQRAPSPPPSPLEAAVDKGTRVIGSPRRPYRLITTGADFDMYPSLSPDGSQVAYESSPDDGGGGQIRVQTSGSAPARTLVERPAGATDRFPHWSPDGREIAFARFSADGRCEVLIVSATGGNLRPAARCDGTELLSFDWTPDGRGLVFGSMVGTFAHRGIRVLDIASGQWRALAYPARGDDFDYAPQVSPDGRWLVFVRNPQVGDLWRMPAGGGPLEQLTDDAAEIRGWAWLGDSRHIVFGRRVDSEVRLYRLDTESRMLRDVGLDDAQWPAVARAANLLAFVQRKAQFGLFSVPLQDPAAARRLFASSARDSQPVLAPDGRQLVFTSDRSGSYGLWWADLQQPGSLRPVGGLRPDTRQPPAWSPDSQRLLSIGRDDHGEPQVHELTPRDERSRVLPAPVKRPLQALYTDDPDRLLLIDRDDGQRTRLSLYDRRSSPWRRLATLDGVSQARFDPRTRRVLFTRFGASGLWSADSQLSATSVQQVSADRPSRWRYRTWAVAGGSGFDYLDGTNDCSTTLARITPGARPLVRCLDARRLSSANGFSASPDGSTLYVSLAASDGLDIGVMSLADDPGGSSRADGRSLIQKGK